MCLAPIWSPWGNASHWLIQRGNRHSAVPGADASKNAMCSSRAWHQIWSPWGNASHWLMQPGDRNSAVPGTDASKSAQRSSRAWHQFWSLWGNASHWLMQPGDRNSAVPGTDASKNAKRISERLKGASDGCFKREQYERKGMGHSDRWKSRSRHSASDPRPRTNHRSGPAIPRTRSANNCDPAELGKATIALGQTTVGESQVDSQLPLSGEPLLNQFTLLEEASIASSQLAAREVAPSLPSDAGITVSMFNGKSRLKIFGSLS
jgi:hypothetical protein